MSLSENMGWENLKNKNDHLEINRKNFLEWLGSKSEAGEKTLSVLVLLIELLLVYFSSTENLSILITLVINFLFLCYFIFKFNRHYRRPFDTKNFDKLKEFALVQNMNEIKFWKYEKRANKSVVQFRTFENFLYATAALYFVLIFGKIHHVFFTQMLDSDNFSQDWIKYWMNLIVHFFSYVGAVYIIRCFYIMYFPTFRDKDIHKKLRIVEHFWFGIFLILSIESIMTLPIEKITPHFPLSSFYFEFICSVANAVAMMLLFARFESKILGIHPAVTLILYVYAIMQVALPFVTDNILNLFFESKIELNHRPNYEAFTTVILVICLIGKLVFFNIVVYLYKTKRLFYYFIKTAVSNETEEEYWEQFAENTEMNNRII
jgi:hypothetical protein